MARQLRVGMEHGRVMFGAGMQAAVRIWTAYSGWKRFWAAGVAHLVK